MSLLEKKIKYFGELPVFGIDDKLGNQGLLLDSYTTDMQSKSVEITNGYGQKTGEVIYDQTLTYTYTGTLLENDCATYVYPGGVDKMADALLASDSIELKYASKDLPLNCTGHAIAKTVSISRNAGQVAKITVTGEHRMAGTNSNSK